MEGWWGTDERKEECVEQTAAFKDLFEACAVET